MLFIGLASIFFNRYCVPTEASQCIPETAPVRTTAQIGLLHHLVSHGRRNRKNTQKAVILATTAIVIASITKGTE
jgi:hypothetical protein